MITSRHRRLAAVATATATAAAVSAALLATPPALAGTVRFVVTDLGTLGGTRSTAFAINSQGQVGGSSTNPGDVFSQPFVWSAGTMLRVGSGFGDGAVTALNKYGDAVGQSGGQAVRFGRPNQNIGDFGGGQGTAADISISGVVVGSALDSTGVRRAFLQTSAGALVDITAPNTSSAMANAINDTGLIVGSAEGGPLFVQTRAALWRNGGFSWIDVTPPPNALYSSAALAVNNLGTVVGYGGDLTQRAYLRSGTAWEPLSGEMDLGDPLTPMVRASRAQGINDNGQIVGHAWGTRGIGGDLVFETGFLHAQDRRHDLNTLLSGNPAASVLDAVAINANGQIAANGRVAGQARALLLTPTGFLTWRGGSTGRFHEAENWDSGGLGFAPNKFLTVLLDSPTSVVTLMSRTAEVQSLLVGTNSPGGSATLRLDLALSEPVLGNVVIGLAGELTGQGSLGGEVTNLGVVRTQLGDTLSMLGHFSNQGLLTGAGTLRGSLDNAGSGSLVVQGNSSFTLHGLQHDNRGTIDVRQGSTLDIAVGQLTSSGTVRVEGTLMLQGTAQDPGLVNRGLVTLGSAFGNTQPRLQGDVRNEAGGHLEVARANAAVIEGSLVNQGEVQAASASTVRYLGDVSGSGSFIAGTGARHVFMGRYEPGALQGETIASVSLSQAEFAGVLELQIGGPVAGSGHDHIDFTSNAWFDAGARIELELINGFAPKLGQDFVLFSFARAPLSAAATLLLPGLTPGLNWDPSTLFIDGHLRVAAVPEPAGWALMLAGTAALCLFGRRQGLAVRRAQLRR